MAIPLADSGPDVRLDLQALIGQAHEAGSYQDRIPYDQPCLPPLTTREQAWANQVLREKGAIPPSTP